MVEVVGDGCIYEGDATGPAHLPKQAAKCLVQPTRKQSMSWLASSDRVWLEGREEREKRGWERRRAREEVKVMVMSSLAHAGGSACGEALEVASKKSRDEP